jgi:lipopolysaccharide/colanic/teichoic acid biosynthesis glycosyltransferase
MRSRCIILWLVLVDGACALLALMATSNASWMSERLPPQAIAYSTAFWFLALLLVWILVCDRMQLGEFYTFRSELIARVVVATVIEGIGVVVLNELIGPPLHGLRVSVFVAVFFASVSIVRLARRAIYIRRHLSSKRHRVVIIGSGPLARELANSLRNAPRKRYDVIGVLAPEMQEMAAVFPNLAKESTVASIGVSDYLTKKNVDQVYLALPNSADADVLRLVAQCRSAGIAVSFVPHAYELFITRSVLRTIGGIPLVAVNERQVPGHMYKWKVSADACVAATILVLASPLMFAVGTVLYRTRGRAFRHETRCGAGGRLFEMYRFNIKRHESPVNWLDRWLEITSISELPQLFNVIRGEMSLVGPRPETAGQVQHYSEWQRQRLDYKPGITGYAQLYGLRERNTSEEKARHDIRYPLGWSPLLDLTMILQTLWIICCRGSKALLSLPASAPVSDVLTVNMEVASVNSSQPSAN